MKREFVVLIKFSKVCMTQMIKNMVTVFFRRREGSKEGVYKVLWT